MVDRIIKRNEFRELIGISKTTEWRMQQAGLLPKAVKVNNRILGYLESDYKEWLCKNIF